MKDNKLFSLIGIGVLVLYLIAAVIFLVNFRSEVEVQRVRTVKPLGSVPNETKLESLLKNFIRDTGGMVNNVEISYDQSNLTVDLSDKWNNLAEGYQEKLIKKFGRSLIGIYNQAGYGSVRLVKFYDPFTSGSQDYVR